MLCSYCRRVVNNKITNLDINILNITFNKRRIIKWNIHSITNIKRNTIIKNDKSGVFIPICTKNVFLKYYSKKFTDVMFWKEEDAKAYQENIEQVLSFYLPKAQ